MEKNTHTPNPGWSLIRWSFGAGVLALIITAVATAAAFRLAEGQPVWEVANRGHPAIMDAVKLGLTSAAGSGAAVALVVALRRQRHLEEDREGERTEQIARAADARETRRAIHERYQAATAQLGHDNLTVRLAGVYALAAVADDWLEIENRGQAQVCVDVLCAYLRTPPATTRRPDEQPDLEVRQTITRVLTQHLQADATASWQYFDLDFTGVNFAGNHLFDDATFSGRNVIFERTRFTGDVSFKRAEFTGKNVSFMSADFTGPVTSFEDARFSADKTSFFSATFSGWKTTFKDAQFSGDRVDFHFAKFERGETSFNAATFDAPYFSFYWTEFIAGEVSFESATFQSGRIDFDKAQFIGSAVSFEEARFTGAKVSFGRANLAHGTTPFGESTFSHGELTFDKADFSGGEISFHNVVPADGAGIVVGPWPGPPASLPRQYSGSKDES